MSELRLRRFWLLGGCTLVLGVIVGCLLPASTIASVAVLPDKIEHGGAYFGLSLWFSALYPRRAWWKLALALAVLGGAIEIAQGLFTATRQADIMDELANCAGIAVGFAIAALGGSRWALTAERLFGLARR